MLLLVSGLAGCARSDDDEPETRRGVESAQLTVVDGQLRRATWALGDEVYGLPPARAREKLVGIVHAPLTGALSPAAILDPATERRLAYNSFARQRPVLRIHELDTNDDFVLDVGTYSPAWRRDGALAYFKGLEERVQDPVRHRGHVVVRATIDAAPVRWTDEPGVYVVSAWAGERLIVHERQGQAWPNVLVLDARGRKRVLVERAGLIAVSPDGTRAVVTKEPDPTPQLSVVEVATAEELASFTFSTEVDPIRGQPINYVADSGAWAGDTVIAAATRSLAVFRVSDDEIVLEELLGVDPDAFPTGVTEPKSDRTGRYVVAAAELMQRPRAAVTRTALMECDRVRRRCVLGRSAPSFQPPRVVYNPSRP